ncbi:MAG: hypothetical protein LUD72_01100 [Bacteroidales bacterium]|nr:hypothetical protein [Bacteroidales bacterium]
MLYNTVTRKWEWWTVGRPLRTPWKTAWARLGWALRYVRRHSAFFPYEPCELEYELDPDTLNMRDPKRERRTRRRERRDRIFAKAVNALNAMVEMQKHIG